VISVVLVIILEPDRFIGRAERIMEAILT